MELELGKYAFSMDRYFDKRNISFFGERGGLDPCFCFYIVFEIGNGPLSGQCELNFALSTDHMTR